jgi:ligand-binding sensor domain-containing protein/two-component sensor histidine kinase
MSIHSSYIKAFIICFLTLLISCSISAQDYSYKHYGVEDGLPSSEVYSAFQDSKGYMWFATDAGVSRFNGYEFENFDASDGLTDNTVFLITEDHKGRIWFGTFNLKLCYYENDSIYPYKYNDEIAKKKIAKRAIHSFGVGRDESVWLSFYANGIFKIDKEGKLNQMIEIPEGIDWVNKEFIVANKSIKGSLSNKRYNNKRGMGKNFSYTQLCNYKGFEDYINHVKYFDNTYNLKSEIIDSSLLLFHGRTVTLINRKGKAQNIKTSLDFTRGIFSLMADENFIWICQKTGVSKCIIKHNSLSVTNHFLESEPVSRVYKDRENGYWFMTLNNGIYYLSNENISVVKKGDVSALEIDQLTGVLYTAIDKNVIKKQIGDINEELIVENVDVEKLKYNNYSNSLLIGTTGEEASRLNNQYKYSLIGKHRRYTAKAFLVDSNLIYRVSNAGLGVIKNDQEIFNSNLNGDLAIWCTSILKNKDKLWIGTNEGIRIYQDKTITAPFKGNKYLSSSITSMERLNANVFLIGTKSYGVLVIKNDSIINIINKEVGLSGDLIRTIHVDNQQEIWVGTNTGLSRIKYKEENNFIIYNLTPKHGLISGEITDICSYKNTIYVGTPKGLVEFDKTKINANTAPPPIYITEFNVNTRKREIKENENLSYRENLISIHFEGLNYRSLGEVEYQYRMLGVDTNWTSTVSRSVQYPTLGYGNYTFEVKAKNEDGYWSNSTTLSFVISPPFWLTWWFILIEIVFGLFFIASFFIVREKQIKKKERVERKMIELELKALRSQMNPHFIFNTLNSIQNYIALNDFKSSNKYITQFARLIRTVLNLSEKNMITIQEEIDVLKMYMDLERMRFDQQFDYEIKISEEIDSDYDKIPSMLLQPYVENAIWHGLMNKKEKGRIKIEIKLKENYLCCSIEDNGIGRKKAAEISANRKIAHKSVGMSITKERLDLMSSAEVNVNIIDIINSTGEEIGTKVIVKIPYKE